MRSGSDVGPPRIRGGFAAGLQCGTQLVPLLADRAGFGLGTLGTLAKVGAGFLEHLDPAVG